MKDDKSISKKIDELEEKMSWFQSGEFNLDEAAERYAEVERLADEIEKVLLGMQNQVEVIKKKFD